MNLPVLAMTLLHLPIAGMSRLAGQLLSPAKGYLGFQAVVDSEDLIINLPLQRQYMADTTGSISKK